MRIAVCYDNGNVFQHFGKTENFKIYDVEEGKIVSSEVMSCGDTGHEALAGLLADNGVEVVICGGLGGGAQAALAEAGVEVFSGAEGDTDDAVRSYLQGTLVSGGVNCDHHDEHHDENGGSEGCGSHCGGHDSDSSEGCNCGDDESCNCGDDEGCSCGDDEGCSCGDDEGCGGCCGGCGGHREMQIIYEGKNAGKTCKVHYTGTFDDGTKFDSSLDRNQPLEFLCGVGMMIEGFDKAVADMEIGDEIDIHLMPEEAYGNPDPDAVIKSDIKDIPGSENLNVGEELYLQADNGRPFPVVVTDKTDTTIVLDANHKLAGKELNFHIQLLSAE
jgi:FKBP-type peptidyl-prolyl cis-trans isomerase 2/predicted Fe-Mo cluster-binding NifX family protein